MQYNAPLLKTSHFTTFKNFVHTAYLVEPVDVVVDVVSHGTCSSV